MNTLRKSRIHPKSCTTVILNAARPNESLKVKKNREKIVSYLQRVEKCKNSPSTLKLILFMANSDKCLYILKSMIVLSCKIEFLTYDTGLPLNKLQTIFIDLLRIWTTFLSLRPARSVSVNYLNLQKSHRFFFFLACHEEKKSCFVVL